MRLDIYMIDFHVRKNVYAIHYSRRTDTMEDIKNHKRLSGTKQLTPTSREYISANSQDEAVTIVKEQFQSTVPDTFVEIEAVSRALANVLFNPPKPPAEPIVEPPANPVRPGMVQ